MDDEFDTEETEDTTMLELLQSQFDALDEAAVAGKPRLFAIHGLGVVPPHTVLLGWGMEFPDGGGAVFGKPGSAPVHRSESADRIWRALSTVAEVRLTWLDQPS